MTPEAMARSTAPSGGWKMCVGRLWQSMQSSMCSGRASSCPESRSWSRLKYSVTFPSQSFALNQTTSWSFLSATLKLTSLATTVCQWMPSLPPESAPPPPVLTMRLTCSAVFFSS